LDLDISASDFLLIAKKGFPILARGGCIMEKFEAVIVRHCCCHLAYCWLSPLYFLSLRKKLVGQHTGSPLPRKIAAS